VYRQDHGRFEDVAAAVGLADDIETRTAACGFDGDRHVDLYVGFIDKTRGGDLDVCTRSIGHGEPRRATASHGAVRATRELRIMAP